MQLVRPREVVTTLAGGRWQPDAEEDAATVRAGGLPALPEHASGPVVKWA